MQPLQQFFDDLSLVQLVALMAPSGGDKTRKQNKRDCWRKTKLRFYQAGISRFTTTTQKACQLFCSLV